MTTSAEPPSNHWPTYAIITFGLAGVFAAAAVISFALMHVGRPYAPTYAICCTVSAVVVYAATIVCLKLDRVLQRLTLVAQLLGHVRGNGRTLERIEEAAIGINSTVTTTLQHTTVAQGWMLDLGKGLMKMNGDGEERMKQASAHWAAVHQKLGHVPDAVVQAVGPVIAAAVAEAKAELRREWAATINAQRSRRHSRDKIFIGKLVSPARDC